MAFDSDALIDRRRLRRHLTAWRVIAVVLAVGLIVTAAGRYDGLIGRDYIARLSVDGVIVDDAERDRKLHALRDDNAAQALIVRIDSPGGTVVGGEALFRRLRDIAGKKPVVAVMGTLATSAGYMAALGGDHVIAHEGTLTGSIGVILQATEITDLLANLGIRTEAVKSGRLKAVPSPLEELTPAGREAMNEIVSDVFDMFVDMVAERRRLDRQAVLRLADGRVYTGRQAMEAKLIDALGDEQDALAWLESQHGIDRDLRIRDIAPDDAFDLGAAARAIVGGKMVFSETLTLDGLVSLWHPALR